ncbi:MAG: hypothetical protein H7Z13_07015 [Ferruginibacter sp.]|nr:hypothetical protein [Ferruginibacter sp.]
MKRILIIGFLTAFASCNRGRSHTQQPTTSDETQYLIFQLFTYNPSSNGFTQPWDTVSIINQIDEILMTVNNNHGDGINRQLGFGVGPLSLDHTDSVLRTVIRESFKIAEAKNVAVVFHVDESMFWINRPDLWSNPDNAEWSDWNKTVLPHRYVSWAPVVLAPQMCYNSPGIKQEIQRIARDVIGAEIKKGIDSLRSKNKEKLFAGVIAGWETHLADHRYVDTGDQAANQLGIPRVRIGYNALSNLGYSISNPPSNFDSVLERVVHDYADFWAIKLGEAKVPANRIYTHLAFPVFPSDQQQVMLNQLSNHLGFPANILGFTHTIPGTAFNDHSRPGFSTYPIGFKENNFDGRLAKILQELTKNGNPHWASSEGTNVQGESAAVITSHISWNDYLSGMFNNGASVVTIFAWSDPSPYGTATRSQEAIAAYKKFLTGGL